MNVAIRAATPDAIAVIVQSGGACAPSASRVFDNEAMLAKSLQPAKRAGDVESIRVANQQPA